MEIYKAIYLVSCFIIKQQCAKHSHYSNKNIPGGWNVFQEQIVIKTAIHWTQWCLMPYLYYLV